MSMTESQLADGTLASCGYPPPHDPAYMIGSGRHLPYPPPPAVARPSMATFSSGSTPSFSSWVAAGDVTDIRTKPSAGPYDEGSAHSSTVKGKSVPVIPFQSAPMVAADLYASMPMYKRPRSNNQPVRDQNWQMTAPQQPGLMTGGGVALGLVTLAPGGRAFVAIKVSEKMTILLREDATRPSFDPQNKVLIGLAAQAVERLKRRELELLKRGEGVGGDIGPKLGAVEVTVPDSGCWMGCRKPERYVGPCIRVCTTHAQELGLCHAVIKEHERNSPLWAVLEGRDVRVFLPRAKQLTKVTKAEEVKQWHEKSVKSGGPAFDSEEAQPRRTTVEALSSLADAAISPAPAVAEQKIKRKRDLPLSSEVNSVGTTVPAAVQILGGDAAQEAAVALLSFRCPEAPERLTATCM